MTTRESYTLKEIVLGTRPEYFKNETYLGFLKNLTTADKEVGDFAFNLRVSHDEKPEIRCLFKQNPNTLKGKIIKIKKKLNRYYYGPERGKVLKDNNDNYYIVCSGYDAYIYNDEMKKFDEIVNKVLNSDFANKIKFGHYFSKGDYDISILPSGIYLEDNTLGYKVKFSYCSRNDMIEIKCPKSFEINKEIVSNLLDINIPAILLSDYHKQIIEENLSSETNMELCMDCQSSNKMFFVFDDFWVFDENEEKIILTQIK